MADFLCTWGANLYQHNCLTYEYAYYLSFICFYYYKVGLFEAPKIPFKVQIVS